MYFHMQDLIPSAMRQKLRYCPCLLGRFAEIVLVYFLNSVRDEIGTWQQVANRDQGLNVPLDSS